MKARRIGCIRLETSYPQSGTVALTQEVAEVFTIYIILQAWVKKR